MTAHTLSCQQAFSGHPERLKQALDARLKHAGMTRIDGSEKSTTTPFNIS